AGDIARGLVLFSGSLIRHGLLGRARVRGLFEVPELVRWAVGMVVLWEDDDDLRARLREALTRKMADFQPDAVLAHSLGSLICYDTFIHAADAVRGKDFVSFGSQIGNPAVLNTFGGRLLGLPAARFWFHLHDPFDVVLTAGVRDDDPNFSQVEITGSD